MLFQVFLHSFLAPKVIIKLKPKKETSLAVIGLLIDESKADIKQLHIHSCGPFGPNPVLS